LWKSDGSAGGTVLVAEINPGGAGSNPARLTNVNGRLYFAADDGVHGPELWQSDGTAAGTVLVKDINPGPEGSDPDSLASMNNKLYFAATDPTHGRELWDPPAVMAPPTADHGSRTDGDPLVAPVDPGRQLANSPVAAGRAWRPRARAGDIGTSPEMNRPAIEPTHTGAVLAAEDQSPWDTIRLIGRRRKRR
jgi:ELWxxDGT repeat protein